MVAIDDSDSLDLKAICIFAAIGFFLDDDTYWQNVKVAKPASEIVINNHEKLESSTPWFQWHYQPRDLTFDSVLGEFTALYESIIKEQTLNKKVILPLSGGLDSRTQAVALKNLKSDVQSYSYEYKNGYNETKISKKIAKSCGFEFKDYQITEGYLWDVIDDLAKSNHCFTDFTISRQAGIYEEFKSMGEVFSLGHWGDVLFNNMGVHHLSLEEEVELIYSKLIKRGGENFARDLWSVWGLKGDFEIYLKERLTNLLEAINIDNSNAKLRAFKSMYWAPRWTSENLSIFSSKKPITLPYYDDRMCKFICSVPEKYLADRQIQIEYIKQQSPELAKITWQDQRPFNLNNYNKNRFPFNLPYKIINKTKRTANTLLGNHYVQRNWELQFKGDKNRIHLKHYLLDNNLNSLIPISLVEKYFKNFINKDALNNAHAINILLVLSKFNERKKLNDQAN